MKNTLTPARLWLFSLCLFSTPFLLYSQKPVAEWLQNQTGTFQEVPLFRFSDDVQNRNDAPENATFLKIDEAILIGLHQNSPDALSIHLPSADGNDLELHLARVEILAPDFKITLNDGQPASPADYPKGVFYRGIVDGDNSSAVSFSIFEKDVQAMILTDDQNFFLEKNGANSSEFILFNTADAPNPHARACEGIEISGGPTAGDSTAVDRGVGCKVVSIYFETDYQMFLDKGSVANVTAYVTGLFSQIATLYANENIAVQISQINAWSIADPYVSLTSTGAVLNSFLAAKGTSFTGDLAHFLSTRALGGGVAYVDVLCLKGYAFGVSQVYNTYANVPAYSWSVEVVTHELGHNFGAWHTHSCNWPGGPIDNCYAVEGACTAGPTPTNGGTIMSYCHLTGVGINFANGFGSVAGNHVRSKTLNSSCLAQTGVAPTTFSTANLTASGVQLNWGTVSGAVSYQVQFKTTAASVWTNAGTFSTTSTTLSGLLAATSYQWQVKTDCSTWSATQLFTTGSAAAVCSAPAGTTTTAITSSGATLVWNSVSGAANYTIQYKTAAVTTWTTVATVTGTNLNLTGLAAATDYNWMVKADCSGNSTQVNFTTATAPPPVCSAPAGLNTTAITSSGATLVWNSVPGATSYTVQYKKNSSSSWTTASAVATTNLNLTGLSAATAYNWQVKANCSGNSTQVNFTTASAPVTNCSKPTGMKTTGLLPNSAIVSWNAVSGATSYTVKYKLKSASNYTTLPTVTTTSLNLTGLAAGKQYNWQVKANCSSNTSTQNFTTPAALPEISDETGILPSDRVLVLSPNPIGTYGGDLRIQLNRKPSVGTKLLLADATGRVIRQMDFTDSDMRLPVTELPYGIYSILIFEEGHRVAAQRFVRIE